MKVVWPFYYVFVTYHLWLLTKLFFSLNYSQKTSKIDLKIIILRILQNNLIFMISNLKTLNFWWAIIVRKP